MEAKERKELKWLPQRVYQLIGEFQRLPPLTLEQHRELYLKENPDRRIILKDDPEWK